MAVQLYDFSLDRMVRAVEKVRRRLRRATEALDRSGVQYAVVCGNAVAAWVATVDESAVRNTPDVEVFLRSVDLTGSLIAMESANFEFVSDDGIQWFQDKEQEASPRDRVRIFMPGDGGLAEADINEVDRFPGYNVMKLEPLVRLNLSLYRTKHQVHLRDLIEVGLIHKTWPSRFEPVLAERLQELLDDPEG